MGATSAVGHQLSGGNLGVIVSLIVAVASAAFSTVRYLRDTGLSRKSERALRTLLKGGRFRFRWSKRPQPFVSFRVVRHHVGGYSDRELRQLLVNCGALRFSDENGVEYWALIANLTSDQRSRLDILKVPVMPLIAVRDLHIADEKGAAE